MNCARAIATSFMLASSITAGFSTAYAQINTLQLSGMQMIATGKDAKSLGNFEQVGTANWRIGEQAMAADYGQGFLVTKESYGDFQLRLEYWADEGTNSGVFIRCENPGAPGAQSCYEINIFDGNPNRNNATGSVVGVAAPLRIPQTELKWNILDIEARGSQINVSVNNERTVSVRDFKHARGRIALQRNAGVIYFRNVQIRSLTPDDIANEAELIYAACEGGFGIIFPSGTEPQIRNTQYMGRNGTAMPAKEYVVQKGGNTYTVTSVEFPVYSDREITNHAMAELRQEGPGGPAELRRRGLGPAGRADEHHDSQWAAGARRHLHGREQARRRAVRCADGRHRCAALRAVDRAAQQGGQRHRPCQSQQQRRDPQIRLPLHRLATRLTASARRRLRDVFPPPFSTGEDVARPPDGGGHGTSALNLGF